jgi:hypothetical protein
MESESLKRGEAEAAFERFKEAVSKLASVPKSAITQAKRAKPIRNRRAT